MVIEGRNEPGWFGRWLVPRSRLTCPFGNPWISPETHAFLISLRALPLIEKSNNNTREFKNSNWQWMKRSIPKFHQKELPRRLHFWERNTNMTRLRSHHVEDLLGDGTLCLSAPTSSCSSLIRVSSYWCWILGQEDRGIIPTFSTVCQFRSLQRKFKSKFLFANLCYSSCKWDPTLASARISPGRRDHRTVFRVSSTWTWRSMGQFAWE